MNVELTKTLYEKRSRVGIVKFNQPAKLNAIDDTVLEELAAILEAAEQDPEIGCLVLTGEGPKAFSAGGDIGEEIKKGSLEGYDFVLGFTRVNYLIEHARMPVIAAINGWCLGGGTEISLACDIRIAADNAKMGSPEVDLGLMPGVGGTTRLPRIIGESKAKIWVFTGDKYTAQQCLELGVVDMVVPADKLLEEAVAFAERLAAKPPLAIKYLKANIHEGLQIDLDRALRMEGFTNALLFGTADKYEAMLAFMEKREHRPWVGK